MMGKVGEFGGFLYVEIPYHTKILRLPIVPTPTLNKKKSKATMDEEHTSTNIDNDHNIRWQPAQIYQFTLNYILKQWIEMGRLSSHVIVRIVSCTKLGIQVTWPRFLTLIFISN